MKLQDLQNARNTLHLLNVAANVHYHQLHGSLLNTEFSKDHLLAQVSCPLEIHVFIIVTFSIMCILMILIENCFIRYIEVVMFDLYDHKN